MSNSLTFQNTTFDVVDRNGQPWIQSRQLAAALGYKDEMSVTKIYERNTDEFTDEMTAKVKLTLGNTPVEVRIFSPRGCYAVAMFARTHIAKAFRVWVLDVLETLNKSQRPALPSVTISPEQQRQLHDIMDAKVKMLAPELSGKARAEAWTRFNRHFRISKYEQLPAERFSEGTEYLINMVLKTAGAVAVPDVAPTPAPAPKPEDLQRAMWKVGDIMRDICRDVLLSSQHTGSATPDSVKAVVRAYEAWEDAADILWFRASEIHRPALR